MYSIYLHCGIIFIKVQVIVIVVIIIIVIVVVIIVVVVSTNNIHHSLKGDQDESSKPKGRKLRSWRTEVCFLCSTCLLSRYSWITLYLPAVESAAYLLSFKHYLRKQFTENYSWKALVSVI